MFNTEEMSEISCMQYVCGGSSYSQPEDGKAGIPFVLINNKYFLKGELKFLKKSHLLKKIR